MENENTKKPKRPYLNKEVLPIGTERAVYSIVQLAAYLDLSLRFVSDEVAAKKIKAYKVGRAWRVLHTDVLAYIVTCETNE